MYTTHIHIYSAGKQNFYDWNMSDLFDLVSINQSLGVCTAQGNIL